MSNIYSRVHNKKGTEDFWNEINPILLDGEIILVATEGAIRLKIGDGITEYINLPFLDSDLRELIDTKLSATFSSEDADKVLGINEEGKVVPKKALGDSPVTWGDFLGVNHE